MSILKIARMGSPILHQVAKKVENPKSKETADLVGDMIETLEDAGGVGLAAPQVHVSQRIVIFFIPESRVQKGEIGGSEELTIMINPEIKPLGEEQELDWEACLSVPNLMGSVPRFRRILYSWTDLNGLRFEREACGFHARAVQHECDHLDGFLYPMRMTDLSLFGYMEEVNRNTELLDAGTTNSKESVLKQ